MKQILQNGNTLKQGGGHIGVHYIILSCFPYSWNVRLKKRKKIMVKYNKLGKYIQNMYEERVYFFNIQRQINKEKKLPNRKISKDMNEEFIGK